MYFDFRKNDVLFYLYSRLVDWVPYFEERYKLPVEFTTWQALLTIGILKYSKIVIQRDAIPSDDV